MNKYITTIVIASSITLSGCGVIRQAIDPDYKTHLAKINGESELAAALASKQVAVQTAKAKAESAAYEKQAEITRAEGAAAAIKITGEALQQHPEYLRYLYVNNLAESKDQIIYIPTEAGLPILEAGRRPIPSQNQ